MAESIVSQAKAQFEAGEYTQAKQLYQSAQNLYGTKLFEVNVALCDARLSKNDNIITELASPSCDHNVGAEQQLEQTQALLEKYYTKYQQAVWKLQDLEQKDEQ